MLGSIEILTPMIAAWSTSGRKRLPYADESDHAYCRALHRKHGTTYFFASRRLPRETRRHVDSLYGFVREADEWVDNPGTMTLAEQAEKLADFREQLIAGCKGVKPNNPTLRAFCDTMAEVGMSPDEPLIFLDAMAQDLTVTRYETWDDLCGYMRGSAAAVGIMMCTVTGTPQTPETLPAAVALGNAMQLTNFIRDVGEDWQRGRIYLALEDLRRHGLSERDIAEGKVSDAWKVMLAEQIARARDLFRQADSGIPMIPSSCRLGVQIARELYAKILDKVEERGYDVFSGRARTTGLEKSTLAVKLIVSTLVFK